MPIFEDGDFGSWEKDTLEQCLTVVKSSDVFVLLVNKKAGAGQQLLQGNVTPTYLEYKAALAEKKHILTFVTPEIKKNFMYLKDDLERINQEFLETNHRLPDSPFDPFEKWIEKELNDGGFISNFLKIADPFVWAFLFDVYKDRNWLYEFDISESEKNAIKISELLSTSLRSVVDLIANREVLEQLQNQTSYLLNYAEQSLEMLSERNLITRNGKNDWSEFLTQAILFLNRPANIIQAATFNPTIVNTITGCFAASLYAYDQEDSLMCIGIAGDISAQNAFKLTESNVFVVDAYTKNEKLIAYREEKQTLYITEPLGESVLCLHFSLEEKWTEEQVIAYAEEIEHAIINKNEYFLDFIRLLIGGRI
ncbi:hypothetical protein AUO94_08095 [Planococcus kocurii]|uniref:DUF4062 domain-containing protein n=1 Tax=Planococcus kocurii TaxID=1374 RepID=A0ABN4JUL8_9BACL|nr:hypothetical protein AUO94_08095 [Planococcus kocurii]